MKNEYHFLISLGLMQGGNPKENSKIVYINSKIPGSNGLVMTQKKIITCNWIGSLNFIEDVEMSYKISEDG